MSDSLAYVVAERTRLEAAVQQRQLNPRVVPAETAIRERLFMEARSYAEKANVVDYVEDRVDFIRSGQIKTRGAGSLNLGRVARAAQRIFEAAREISSDHPVNFPAWRLVSRFPLLRAVSDAFDVVKLFDRERAVQLDDIELAEQPFCLCQPELRGLARERGIIADGRRVDALASDPTGFSADSGFSASKFQICPSRERTIVSSRI
jgi:hypothetical protein